jgi:hypothetical protein
MAHRITYKPSGIIFSHAIGDIVIDVDGSFVDVKLTGQGNTVILAERYYAYGGRVTLYDLASLIEAHMRPSAEPYAELTLKVFSDTENNKADSCLLRVIYCDRFAANPDIDTFLSENFLTTLAMRRVATGSTASLFLFAQQGESLEYSVSFAFRKSDSEALYRHAFTLDRGKTAAASGVVQLNIAQSTIIASAASFALVRLGEVMLLSFTVRCGQRSVSFFIDPTLSDADDFCFRNCFNVWDVATLPLVTKAKTDVERSLAVINGSSRFYNQTTAKTYEVETGPLTSDEAEWIDQLFASHDVFRIERDATNEADPVVMVPVLITDSTCEMQDGDEKPNTAKFIWRYADNRPIVRLSASPGIFTSPYNIVYS